ncbi:uncharacterized protein RJT20DRAFT_54591 [Scheffersomyces xylosifermentans]|uniref:uncharacterized protein n=1 Tax=Scheffersomyces xylosifermentans TaxID=1304137 RepID=UPI00315DE074
MKVISFITLFGLAAIVGKVALAGKYPEAEIIDSLEEYGSYINPNPRPYKRCDANDLIKLSGCCNDVLSKLDDCKADDLACECCALQTIKQECYHLCPGNPSANFLTVLYDDCSELNEINACALPFKKDDSIKTDDSTKYFSKSKSRNEDAKEIAGLVTVKSKVNSKLDIPPYDAEAPSPASKMKLERTGATENSEKPLSLQPLTSNINKTLVDHKVNLTGKELHNVTCMLNFINTLILFFNTNHLQTSKSHQVWGVSSLHI